MPGYDQRSQTSALLDEFESFILQMLGGVNVSQHIDGAYVRRIHIADETVLADGFQVIQCVLVSHGQEGSCHSIEMINLTGVDVL